MIQLEKTFKKGGFTYNMVLRSTVAAIFEQRDAGKVIAFEVIRIKKMAPSMCFGKALPEREVYPGNEEWGSKGWTYHTLEAARVKYHALNKVVKKPATA